MRAQYESQVALLIDVLPVIARSKVFALKGGTAINFFHLDCPRLSVDIDLHYLPDLEREQALADIYNNMKEIAEGIERAYPEARVTIDRKTRNAVVARRGTQIKIEPNAIIRGSLLPVEHRSLSPYLENKYGRSVSLPCIAKHELYAGKFCAALERQHPRDLYDVLLFLRENELTPEFMDVFIVYLISQGKPIYEELNPNTKGVQALYEKQFIGMPTKAIALELLMEIQTILPGMILAALEERHRHFLLGFKRGNPNWSLLPHPHAENLPAVRWKQLNLDKMDATKRQQAIAKLQALFEEHPCFSETARMTTQEEITVPQSQQEQLAEKIVADLLENGLIDAAKKKQVSQQVASGTISREDWSLLIELAHKPEKESTTDD